MALRDGDAAAAARRAALARELERDRVGAASHLFTEIRLQRFLQGNEDQVDAAAEHFRKMLAWRAEMKMDEQRKTLPGPEVWHADVVPGLRSLLRIMSTDIEGCTPERDLLWVQCDGLAELDRLMDVSDDDLYRSIFLTSEQRADHLDYLSAETGQLRQVVQVRDLYGLSVTSLLKNRGVMLRLSHITKNANVGYPENIRRVVLMNLPAGFGLLWAALKPLLNARIISKFIFLQGEDPIPELAAQVGTEGLESVVRARRLARHLTAESTHIKVPAGASEYTCLRLAAGEAGDWSFRAGAGAGRAGLLFSARFFADAHRGRTHETVAPLEPADGEVAGSYRASAAGVLWLTWLNRGGWSGAQQVGHLRLRRRAAADVAAGGQAHTGLDTRRRRGRPQQRARDCGCFALPAWWPGAVRRDSGREYLDSDDGTPRPLLKPAPEKQVSLRHGASAEPLAQPHQQRWLPSGMLLLLVALMTLFVKVSFAAADQSL